MNILKPTKCYFFFELRRIWGADAMCGGSAVSLKQPHPGVIIMVDVLMVRVEMECCGTRQGAAGWEGSGSG